MIKEAISQQAKVYLFHLNNANNENGMRKDEGWKFTMANEEGRAAIEHDYYPTVAVDVKKTELVDFSEQVMAGIAASYPKISIPDKLIDMQVGATFLIAHSPQRKIR